jgi:hypothetical protein
MVVTTCGTSLLLTAAEKQLSRLLLSGIHGVRVAQLKMSAALAPMALVIMVITSPLSYPLGKLLDLLVGNDHYQNRRYNRQELVTLVQIHQVRNKKRKADESVPVSTCKCRKT